MTEAITLTAAYLLDLAIGDPKWLPHPVRGIGWTIEKMEKILRRSEVRSQRSEVKKVTEKLSGVLLVATVVGATYGVFYFINKLLLTSPFPLLTSYLAFIILAVLITTTIATRELIKSGQAVLDEIKSGDIERGRAKLGMIVGRDTHSLDQKGVLKATIETFAENASDGIIAPLFYFAIGGLPLAMTYKSINTLDSMVGYKNEKYRNFGWAAARLDDIANYIPARITGILIFIATLILSAIGKLERFLKIGSSGSNGLSGLNSLSIMFRDGRKHSSPNSGIPEAAMAGALGVQLGGPSAYGGIVVEKPFIGEEASGVTGQEPKVKDLYLNASENALSLVKITSLLGFGLALLLLYLRAAI